MKIPLYFLCLFAFFSRAQTVQQCKKRFDTYLNFKGSLNSKVKFEKEVIYINSAQGKKEFAIYENEIKGLALFFENSTISEQQRLMSSKGLRRFTKRETDSILNLYTSAKKIQKQPGALPLSGYRIAIDPGHFSTNLVDAASEQKYLYFIKDSVKNSRDTVKLFESQLTYNTACILKNKLVEQGADVFVTRDRADYTSFNCTYQEWIKKHRKRSLDSLKSAGSLSPAKHAKLLKCNDYTLFWEFFRDYDLANRASKINAFSPHVTLIIHYNVDEKNAPWKKCTPKNYTMAFIGGGFTGDNLDKLDAKLHFIRLLLSDQLNRSEDLSAKTVANFNKQLNITIATANDADYLRDNCLSTSSPGVFCRNLALCRKINSPMVYGESLYQDNEKEAKLLMQSDLDIYGIKANQRVQQVAQSYYDAVIAYLKNN